MTNPQLAPLEPQAAPTGEPVRTADHGGVGKRLFLLTVLVLGSFWAYRNSFTAPFIYDDFRNITDNLEIRSIAPIQHFFEESSRPLLFLSLAVNYQLGELDVRGYHLANFLIHLAAGLTLFGIIRRTLRLPRFGERFAGSAEWLALTIALFWLVHPLQTESVTYVIQRCESMTGLFFLLALYCLIRGATAARSWPWHAASVVACALSMASKEVGVVIPIVVILYDWTFLSGDLRLLLRRRGLLYAVQLSLVALLCMLVVVVWSRIDAPSAGFGFQATSPLEYLANQPRVILHYLGLAVWPDPLCLDYMWQKSDSWRELALPFAIVTLGFVASLYGVMRRSPLGFLGLAFYVILAPTSSIMPIADLAAEHRMYLPLACVLTLLVIAVHGGVVALLRDAGARGVLYAGLILGVAFFFIVKSVDRNRDYLDPYRMWTKVVQVAPHNWRAQQNVGLVLDRRGDTEGAIRQCRIAIGLNPNVSKLHLGLATALARDGQNEAAVAHFQEAIRLKPGDAAAHISFGNLRARQTDFVGAIELYRQALEMEPDNSLALIRLGLAQYALQRPAEALQSLAQAHRVRPDLEEPLLWLAWIQATSSDAAVRRGEESLRLARELVYAKNVRHARAWDVLAAAYAERGEFPRAIDAAQQALQAMDWQADAAALRMIRQRLELYRRGEPYRETAPPIESLQALSTAEA